MAEAPVQVLSAAAAAMEEGAKGTGAPLSGEEMAIRLARVAVSPHAEEERKTARERLASAEAAYFALDLPTAKRYLAEALNAASRTPQAPEDLALVSDLRLLEGMITLPTDPAAAAALFDSVTLLTPDRVLDPHRYPPPVISAMARATERRRSTAAVGQVDVASEPADALVSVDGVARGHTPLSIDRLVAGEHFYRVEKAGYKPLFGSFVAGAGENAPLAKTLEKLKADDVAPAVAGAVEGGPGHVAALFGVDRVLFAALAADGPRHYSVEEWWEDAAGKRSAPVTRVLSAEPAELSGGLLALTREALAAPEAQAEKPPEVAPLARDTALLATGEAFGELKRPPPAFWNRWQFRAGAAGVIAVGVLAFLFIESSQPAHVNYDVTVAPNQQ